MPNQSNALKAWESTGERHRRIGAMAVGGFIGMTVFGVLLVAAPLAMFFYFAIPSLSTGVAALFLGLMSGMAANIWMNHARPFLASLVGIGVMGATWSVGMYFATSSLAIVLPAVWIPLSVFSGFVSGFASYLLLNKWLVKSSHSFEPKASWTASSTMAPISENANLLSHENSWTLNYDHTPITKNELDYSVNFSAAPALGM